MWKAIKGKEEKKWLASVYRRFAEKKMEFDRPIQISSPAPSEASCVEAASVGTGFPPCQRNMTDEMLEALLAGFAKCYFANPFRLENLCSREASCRVRIKNGVYDVATSCL